MACFTSFVAVVWPFFVWLLALCASRESLVACAEVGLFGDGLVFIVVVLVEVLVEVIVVTVAFVTGYAQVLAWYVRGLEMRLMIS